MLHGFLCCLYKDTCLPSPGCANFKIFSAKACIIQFNFTNRVSNYIPEFTVCIWDTIKAKHFNAYLLKLYLFCKLFAYDFVHSYAQFNFNTIIIIKF